MGAVVNSTAPIIQRGDVKDKFYDLLLCYKSYKIILSLMYYFNEYKSNKVR